MCVFEKEYPSPGLRECVVANNICGEITGVFSHGITACFVRALDYNLVGERLGR